MKKFNGFREFVEYLGTFDDKPALTIKRTFRQESVSYAQLKELALKTANFLRHEGIAPGDRIMIAAPNMPEWGILFLGAELLGITVVPVDARTNIQTIKGFIQSTTPKIIFRGRYVLSDLDNEYKVKVLDELTELIAGEKPELPERAPVADLNAMIVFTSGTTAAPKGVVLTQKNLLSNLAQVTSALLVEPSWRFLSVLPLSHTYELTAGFLAPLSGAASVYYMPRIAPLAIARALNEYKITSVLTVPLLLSLFLKRIKTKAEEEGKLGLLMALMKITKYLPMPARKAVFAPVHKKLGGKMLFFATGGAPVDYEVAKTWELMGVKVLQGYGLTETSPVLSINTLKERNLRSQGRALPEVSLRIAEGGEIQARGDNVFSGYWQNQEASTKAFTPDGWFKTGDVGEINKEGWLYIKGREKFAIVLSSGLKVFPEDVELAAYGNPKLIEIAVIGLKKPEGEVVYAVVISKSSDEEIKEEIAKINSKLEEFQRISSWERWPEEDFPRTRLLKVDRKKVWDWANAKILGTAVEAKELVTTQDKLLDVLVLVSEKPAKEIKDEMTLGELGLDSLRRLTVVSLIEEQMSISIPEQNVHPETLVSELREMTKRGEVVETKIRRPRWTYFPLFRFLGNEFREFATFLVRIFWVRMSIEGRENLAGIKGPAIFIFNHVDGFDAPVMYKSLPRKIRNRLAVAAAQDVFAEHRILAAFARLTFAAYDFARVEPFIESLEYTGKLVDSGYSIAIAPEGKLSESGELQPFKSGTGMLAVEMGLPVVPMKTKGLYGTVPLHHKWPAKRSRVTVTIGRPVFFKKGTTYAEATAELEEVMRAL